MIPVNIVSLIITGSYIPLIKNMIIVEKNFGNCKQFCKFPTGTNRSDNKNQQ